VSTGYVEQRDGVYRVAGTRVSLESIVYAFVSGQSAESIAQSLPVLTLEQVYGAIAFYLAHREAIDRYLDTQEHGYEAKRAAARAADPMFYKKLADAKRQTPLARRCASASSRTRT
jgi:uncharacterized protein (DUF433 family)